MMLHRFFVGLAGPPGAGKSTIAHEVASHVNKLWPEKASSFDSQVRPPDVAIVVPMDGFHLYRSELDAMKVSVLLSLIFCYPYNVIPISFHCSY
jgi:pantothenate kinase